MAEKKEDRRSRRSKRLLKQGLAELMLEKPFNSISVREITDRMDLNRGTFYLHFSDTYDLLQQLETDTLSDVQHMIDEHRSETNALQLRPIFESVVGYIVENQSIWRALFVNNATSDFIDKVYQMFYENVERVLSQRFAHMPEQKLPYLVSFLTFGLIGVLKQWFGEGRTMSEQEIVEIAEELVTGATENLLTAEAR